MGFQAGGTAHDDRLVEGPVLAGRGLDDWGLDDWGLDDWGLIVAGKVHSFVHTRDLLTVTIKHLGFHAVWVEQRRR